MPLDLRINEIFPISDFVRNASEHTARIRRTNRAEILTQHGRPSLAVIPCLFIKPPPPTPLDH